MTLKDRFHAFLSSLCTQWKLESLNPSPLPVPAAFTAAAPWGYVLIFNADNPPPNAWFSIFNQIPDCVVLILSEDMLHVDVGAQSMMDNAPVMARNLSWNELETFWTLGKNLDYISFCLDLSSKFGKRHLEKKFVTDFKKYTRKLANAWSGLHEDNESIRHQLALNTLLRLLFLAFLEARGILDGRVHFLQQEAQKCAYSCQSIYRELIQPLFFETLNRPFHRRTKRAKRLGLIPFLNGGLFTPVDIEIQSKSLDIPNPILLDIIETLFGRYIFNPEMNADTLQTSLDPLMLGHVFESLMCRQQRAATGTFYTPMPLARRMTDSAFVAYLNKNCQLSDKQAEAVIKGDFSTITHETAAFIDNHLADITILDPAAGSGSFLQAAFEKLHLLRMKLGQYLNQSYSPGELARQILSRNLYGVDIIPAANQLCELRLWLELIRHYPQNSSIPPLPNLDLNILCGDALADVSQYCTLLNVHACHSPELPHLKRRYRLSSGKTKKHLAEKIAVQTRETGKKLFHALISACETETRETQISTRDIFTHLPTPTFMQKKRISILEYQKNYLQRALRNDDMIPGFSFDLHFSEIIEKGGFDIVIGNPPWLSLYKLSADVRRVLKNLYRTADSTPGCGKRQSPDISALFVEKSIQCAKIGGLIAMLVPNKLFHAPTYAPFRYHIQTTTYLIEFKDWSLARHNSFQAAAYPASIILQKATPNVTDNQEHPPYEIGLPPMPHHPAFSSPMPTIADVFDIRRGICTGANRVFIGETYAKIDEKTVLFAVPSSRDSERGPSPLRRYAAEMRETHNSAAYAPTPDAGPRPATPRRMKSSLHTSPDIIFPIESALIHPVLRGTDIRTFQAIPKREIILTHDWANLNKPLEQLPPMAKDWFESNSDILRNRKHSTNKPIHAISGASDTLNALKVVWRDISKDLEACFICDKNIIPINTVYYIPVYNEDTGYLLTSWLNSKWARAFSHRAAEHALADYRRYFSWVVGNLPWPFETISTSKSDEVQKIIELSRKAHTLSGHSLQEIQSQINVWIEKCLAKYHSCYTTSRQNNKNMTLFNSKQSQTG